MTTEFDHSKAFAKFRTKAKQHGMSWPSQRAFEQAARYVRPGTDRHLAAALMLGGKVTMEQVENLIGAPQYNVVTALKAAGCKQISGTDKDGYRLYAFQPRKAKLLTGDKNRRRI
jgi:hypothetical protein